MLVACQLAGLSALDTYYAGIDALPHKRLPAKACDRAGQARQAFDDEPLARWRYHHGHAAREALITARRHEPDAGLQGLFADLSGFTTHVFCFAFTRHLLRKARPIALFPPSATVLCSKAAWIDRPVDTQGCAPCFHVLLSAAWKRGHAQANDRHSYRVFAMPPRGFAGTTRTG